MYTIQGYQNSKFGNKSKVIKVRKIEEEIANNNACKTQKYWTLCNIYDLLKMSQNVWF